MERSANAHHHAPAMCDKSRTVVHGAFPPPPAKRYKSGACAIRNIHALFWDIRHE
jgi:hypothetical protein